MKRKKYLVFLKNIFLDYLKILLTFYKVVKIFNLKKTIQIIRKIIFIYDKKIISMNKINYISRVLNEIITLNSINYYTKEIKYFLDVGANSGMTAIAAYYLFEGQAQIYMFEPSKDCFEILLKIE